MEGNPAPSDEVACDALAARLLLTNDTVLEIAADTNPLTIDLVTPSSATVLTSDRGWNTTRFQQVMQDSRFETFTPLQVEKSSVRRPLEFTKAYPTTRIKLYMVVTIVGDEQVRQTKSKNSRWAIRFLDDARDVSALDFQVNTASSRVKKSWELYGQALTIELPSSCNHLVYDDVVQAGEQVKPCLENGPHRIDSYDAGLLLSLLMTAICKKNPAQKLRLVLPDHYATLTSSLSAIITTSVEFIDQDRCKLVQHSFTVETPLNASEFELAGLSDMSDPPEIINDFMRDPVYATMTDIQRSAFVLAQQRASALAREIQIRVFGQVYDQASMGLYIQALKAFYAGQVATLSEAVPKSLLDYRYPSFYKLRVREGVLHLQASEEIQKCLPPRLSLNSIRVQGVMQANEVDLRMLNEYMSSGSVSSAWGAGCVLADVLWNTEIIAEDSLEFEGLETEHVAKKCVICQRAKLPARMTRLSATEYVCNQCAEPETTETKMPRSKDKEKSDTAKPRKARKKPVRKPNTVSAMESALGMTLQGLQLEHNALGFPRADRKIVAKDIKDDVENDYMISDQPNERIYRDAYLLVERTAPINPEVRIRGPFQLELDAADPIALAAEYGVPPARLTRQEAQVPVGIHCRYNLRPTASYANGWMNENPPIALKILSEFRRTGSEGSSEELKVLRDRVMHLYYINIQLPKPRLSRLAVDLTEENLERLERQYRTGIADPDACLEIRRPFYFYGIMSHPDQVFRTHPDTDASGRLYYMNNIENMVKEKEALLNGRMLPRVNGHVWPFTHGPVPTNLTDWAIIEYFADRMRKMLVLCSRHFALEIDHPADLYVLACLQLLDPFEEAKRDPLCGIYSPYSRMLTTGSFGKRRHGDTMSPGLAKDAAGSVTRVYRTLDDWKPAICNILWHTWSYNSALNRFDERADDIIADFDRLPNANEPFWPGQLPALPPVPPVLATIKPSARPKIIVPGRKMRGAGLTAKAKALMVPSEQGPSSISSGGYLLPTGTFLPITEAGDTSLGQDFTELELEQILYDIETGGFQPPDPPARRNMTNGRNGCYFISFIQLLHNIPSIRALFNNADTFKFLEDSNLLTAFNDSSDTHLTRHRALITTLTQRFRELDVRGDQLISWITRSTLNTLNRLSAEFRDEENDPARVMNVLLDVIQRSTDPHPEDNSWKDLYNSYNTEQDDCIRAGFKIKGLVEDRRERLLAQSFLGFGSTFTDLLMVQTATETACPVSACSSPFSRNWTHSLYMTLAVPKDLSETAIITMDQLLESSTIVEGLDASCGCDVTHPKRIQARSKITSLGEVLIMRLDRSRVRTEVTDGKEQIVEDFILNRLRLQTEIDMSRYTDFLLPSELAGLSEQEMTSSSWTKSTIYTLTGVVRFQQKRRHYIEFAKIYDSEGERRWIMQDSLRKEPPEWDETPFDPENNVGTDCILVWHREAPPEPAPPPSSSSSSSASSSSSESGGEADKVEKGLEKRDKEHADDQGMADVSNDPRDGNQGKDDSAMPDASNDPGDTNQGKDDSAMPDASNAAGAANQGDDNGKEGEKDQEEDSRIIYDSDMLDMQTKLLVSGLKALKDQQAQLRREREELEQRKDADAVEREIAWDEIHAAQAELQANPHEQDPQPSLTHSDTRMLDADQGRLAERERAVSDREERLLEQQRAMSGREERLAERERSSSNTDQARLVERERAVSGQEQRVIEREQAVSVEEDILRRGRELFADQQDSLRSRQGILQRNQQELQFAREANPEGFRDLLLQAEWQRLEDERFQMQEELNDIQARNDQDEEDLRNTEARLRREYVQAINEVQAAREANVDEYNQQMYDLQVARDTNARENQRNREQSERDAQAARARIQAENEQLEQRRAELHELEERHTRIMATNSQAEQVKALRLTLAQQAFNLGNTITSLTEDERIARTQTANVQRQQQTLRDELAQSEQRNINVQAELAELRQRDASAQRRIGGLDESNAQAADENQSLRLELSRVRRELEASRGSSSGFRNVFSTRRSSRTRGQQTEIQRDQSAELQNDPEQRPSTRQRLASGARSSIDLLLGRRRQSGDIDTALQRLITPSPTRDTEPETPRKRGTKRPWGIFSSPKKNKQGKAETTIQDPRGRSRPPQFPLPFSPTRPGSRRQSEYQRLSQESTRPAGDNTLVQQLSEDPFSQPRQPTTPRTPRYSGQSATPRLSQSRFNYLAPLISRVTGDVTPSRASENPLNSQQSEPPTQYQPYTMDFGSTQSSIPPPPTTSQMAGAFVQGPGSRPSWTLPFTQDTQEPESTSRIPAGASVQSPGSRPSWTLPFTQDTQEPESISRIPAGASVQSPRSRPSWRLSTTQLADTQGIGSQRPAVPEVRASQVSTQFEDTQETQSQ